MAAEALNEELQYVKLYRIRPIIFHFYLGPFIPIYLIWLYFWTVVYGLTDYFEAGLIALAGIGILQVLCCLFCHWSVHVRCFLTCSAVGIFIPYFLNFNNRNFAIVPRHGFVLLMYTHV